MKRFEIPRKEPKKEKTPRPAMKSSLHAYVVYPGQVDDGFPHYTLYKNAKKHKEEQEKAPENYEPNEIITHDPIFECGEVVEGEVNGEPVILIPYNDENQVVNDIPNDTLKRTATRYATDDPVDVKGPVLVISSRSLNVLKTVDEVEREKAKKEVKPRAGPPKGSRDPEKKKKRKYEEFLKLTKGVVENIPTFEDWCCSKKE